MKLALVSHLASRPSPTGAERSLLLLAAGLKKRGHDLAVTAPAPWTLAAEFEAIDAPVTTIPVRNCWLTHFEGQPLWRSMFRGLRYAFPDPGAAALRRWLDAQGADVVHVNCLPHLRGASAAHQTGRPVVWHIREILPPGRRRSFFAGRLHRHATAIVAVSRAVALWLQDEGLADRTTVVHNGVEAPPHLMSRVEARRQFGLPEDGIGVGLFGQLVRHKGAEDFVRAAHLAGASTEKMFFVIAGNGPPSFAADVRRLIRSGPAAGRIHLLPPQRDIWPVMAAIDIVAQTSLRPDPLPRAVMEAMAAGRPVVAYSGGGVPEMVDAGRTGFLVEPGDVEGLAHHVELLARDPALLKRLGETSAHRARADFSVERHVGAMEEVFRTARSAAPI